MAHDPADRGALNQEAHALVLQARAGLDQTEAEFRDARRLVRRLAREGIRSAFDLVLADRLIRTLDEHLFWREVAAVAREREKETP